MATYNASDIIGKTLIAKKSVQIKRTATDKANAVYTASPNESIGVVYSYLLPNNDRKTLYWQFYDSDNKAYYVAHKVGLFDIQSLSDQGALTLEEKKEQTDAAALSTTDKIFKYAKQGALLAAAVYLTKTLIEKSK
jgi:hypothetical protein